MVLTKRCSFCPPSEALQPVSNFHKSKRGNRCKSCYSKYYKEYYQRNREKVLAYQKSTKNRESQRKRYYRDHQKTLERSRMNNRKHHAAHKHDEQYQVGRRLRAKKHLDNLKTKPENYTHSLKRRKTYHKEYNKTHPEYGQVTGHRHRALIRGSSASRITAKQWLALKTLYGHRCVYCGKKSKRLTMDHIIPLVKGGQHCLDNIAPACHSCNSRKRDKPAPPFQPLLIDLVT